MRRGPLAVLAYSSDDSTELDQGTLLTPDNTIDATTGTIRLKATFPNPQNKLWPGQFINAHLQIGTAHDAVTVPPSGDPARSGRPLRLCRRARRQRLRATPVTIGYQTDATLHRHEGSQPVAKTIVVGGQSRLQAVPWHAGSAAAMSISTPSSAGRSPRRC